uniref:Uncharacterized protein n=1 Tax=Candidatus Kentrum sp. DK TaxID=2126562 RepID=A0A450TEG8_9GAMM|nr:MAG: hypothetical protein BECKDK2373C_GA0170839_11322 [Candidatus Kentron sp. DK]
MHALVTGDRAVEVDVEGLRVGYGVGYAQASRRRPIAFSG